MNVPQSESGNEPLPDLNDIIFNEETAENLK